VEGWVWECYDGTGPISNLAMAVPIFPNQRGIRRIAGLIIGLAVTALSIVGFVTWEIHRLEDAVWDRSDQAPLAARESFLQKAASNRLISRSLRIRAKGLLGDLAYLEGNFPLAQDHYIEAWLWNERTDLNVLISRWILASSTDFGRGFRAYSAGSPTVSLSNDDDLSLDLPDLKETEDAWNAFASIEPLGAPEKSELRSYFLAEPPNHPAMPVFCERHQKTIQSLQQLEVRLRIPDQNDPMLLVEAADFVRLLAVDSICHIRDGNSASAERSFRAAYRVIGYLEQNPRLNSALVSLALRSTLLEWMESSGQTQMGAYFLPDHRCPADLFNRAIAGEYHAMKSTFAAAIPITDATSQRLHARVLNKQIAFWREIRDLNDPAVTRKRTTEKVPEWFFQNRRFIHRMAHRSYADGERFAEALEDLTAEFLHLIAVPNIGQLNQTLDELREREGKFLNGPKGN